MGQAGRSDRAPEVGLLLRVTVAATLTWAALVHGTVVGEHLSEWAPACLFILFLVRLDATRRLAKPERHGELELVEVGVCAVSPARPGRARLKTVPRGRARLVPRGGDRSRRLVTAEAVSAPGR